MIPKGNQRAGGQQLATHLLNAYDNDRVEVAEVRGAIAQDLHGAFAEWYAEAKATDCRKYLYSLSINPDHTQGPYTREHYYDFIRRTEKSLGLANQPRAVVFHVKHGREHCHIVWSRIDTEKMKAVQLSHDRQKLRTVAQEYAHDHNITLPPGMRNNRGKDRFPDHEKTENLAEKQQEERTGISKQERRDQITKLWSESSDGRSFIRALEASGYLLARGDKRAYVVVDLYGEIHSLSRQLTGVKAKELKARLAGYSLDKLPTAADAQNYAREKRQALLIEKQHEDRAHKKHPQEVARQRREELQGAQDLRRAELDGKRKQLVERHLVERKALADLQTARSETIARERADKQPKGLLAVLGRITGYNALTAFRQKWQDRRREQEFRTQKAALARRHGREMENFKHQERGLDALDKRERRSLETGLRREAFRAIAAPAKTKVAADMAPAQRAKIERDQQRAERLAEEFRTAASPRGRRQDAPELSDEQLAKIAEFKKTAGDITKKTREKLSLKFNEGVAGSARPSGGPAAKLDEKAGASSAAKTEKAADRKLALPTREAPPAESAGGTRLRDLKENARDLTAAQQRALDLAKEFAERAGPVRRQKDKDHDDHGHEKHYRRPPQDFSIRR
jgi:MobA/VirD2-like, nuclease domain